MSLDIRPMSIADMQLALDWAAAEGWNPGLDDAAAFLAQDWEGCLMGWLGNEPVGCITVVNYGDGFAFLGLYIVRPEHRGKGHGKAIWDAGTAHAGTRTIGLDGVPAQQDNYRRSGFAFAHGSARWSGVPPGAPAEPRVRALGPDDAEAVIALDRTSFGAPREPFLQAWLEPSHSRMTVGHFGDTRLDGYGSIRRCRTGWKIGPLFAEAPGIARSIMRALAMIRGTEEVAMDIPGPNIEAIELAHEFGLSPTFETARMYRGMPPELRLERTFAVTTLELG